MPTIDSDAHVVESERTWDYMEKADQKYRPVIVKPRGGSNAEYWFIDGKIRGLVRVVMTAKEMDEVAAAHRPGHGHAAGNPRDGKRRRRGSSTWTSSASTFKSSTRRCSSSRSPKSPPGRSPSAAATIAGSPIFTDKGKGRLRWICVLPLLDMSASLEELKFCQAERRRRRLHARHRRAAA